MSFLPVLFWNALEASAVALAVVFVLKVRKLSPSMRHLLWLLVLLKLVAPPWGGHSLGFSEACRRGLGALREGVSADVAPHPSSAGAELVRPKPAALPDEGAVGDPLAGLWPNDRYASAGLGREAEEPTPEEVEFPGVAAAAGSEPALSRASRQPARATATSGHREMNGWTSWTAMRVPPGVLFLSWVSGAMLLGVWQLTRIARFQARVRAADSPPAAVISECVRLSRRLGLRRSPPVRVLPEGTSPLVWGLGRPVILLAPSVCRSSTRSLLRGVLGHELAHIKRRDHWICWLEIVAGCLYWWLPTFWWSRRELRDASDQAADAWGVWALGSREDYAESLMETVEVLNVPVPAVPPLAHAMGPRETIARRLTMIMRESLRPKLSWRARLGAALLGLIVLPVAPQPIAGQEEPSSPEIPEAADELDVPAQAPSDPRASTTAPRASATAEKSIEERLTRLEALMEQVLKELASLRDVAQVEAKAKAKNRFAEAARAYERSVLLEVQKAQEKAIQRTLKAKEAKLQAQERALLEDAKKSKSWCTEQEKEIQSLKNQLRQQRALNAVLRKKLDDLTAQTGRKTKAPSKGPLGVLLDEQKEAYRLQSQLKLLDALQKAQKQFESSGVESDLQGTEMTKSSRDPQRNLMTSRLSLRAESWNKIVQAISTVSKTLDSLSVSSLEGTVTPGETRVDVRLSGVSEDDGRVPPLLEPASSVVRSVSEELDDYEVKIRCGRLDCRIDIRGEITSQELLQEILGGLEGKAVVASIEYKKVKGKGAFTVLLKVGPTDEAGR